jgi:hypothetical protein
LVFDNPMIGFPEETPLVNNPSEAIVLSVEAKGLIEEEEGEEEEPLISETVTTVPESASSMIAVPSIMESVVPVLSKPLSSNEIEPLSLSQGESCVRFLEHP